MSIDGIDAEKARQSLRGEYYAKFEHFLSANTRRSQGHPFEKIYPFKEDVEIGIRKIIEKWRKPKGIFASNESYPDLCIMEPCPFNIVFDAKFFRDESLTSAERVLVTSVYEVVFYRGLPPELGRARPWFGCVLAYDACNGAYLQRVWESVESKRLFWDGAYVFVMIVRGTNPSPVNVPAP